MKSLNEIKKILNESKEELREKYKIKEIGIFGSYIKEKQKKRSDLDILVGFEEPVSLLELVGIELYLSKILKVKVDLIPRDDLRPELKDDILKEALFL